MARKTLQERLKVLQAQMDKKTKQDELRKTIEDSKKKLKALK